MSKIRKFSSVGVNIIVIAGAFYLYSNWYDNKWAAYVAGALSLIGIIFFLIGRLKE